MKVPSDAGRVVGIAVDGSNITLPGVLFSGSAGKTLHCCIFDSLSSLDPVLVASYHFRDLSWLVPQWDNFTFQQNHLYCCSVDLLQTEPICNQWSHQLSVAMAVLLVISLKMCRFSSILYLPIQLATFNVFLLIFSKLHININNDWVCLLLAIIFMTSLSLVFAIYFFQRRTWG